MRKRTLLVVVTVCLFFNANKTLFGQSLDSTIQLTQEQMKEDFACFLKVIEEVNPQLTLRKKVTGTDILENIK
jgi:hypothetical protein